MENATRRIRKARRQGMAPGGVSRSPRVPLRGATRNADTLDTPRPNRARKTRVTRRKTKRQGKSPARGKR